MALGKFGAKKGKRHVTARVMVSPNSPPRIRGRFGDEVTLRGPSHANIVEQAARDALGGRIPYNCKLAHTRPKRLPGRTGGAEAHLMCDVATIWTTAVRNPKRGKKMSWGGAKRRR